MAVWLYDDGHVKVIPMYVRLCVENFHLKKFNFVNESCFSRNLSWDFHLLFLVVCRVYVCMFFFWGGEDGDMRIWKLHTHPPGKMGTYR